MKKQKIIIKNRFFLRSLFVAIILIYGSKFLIHTGDRTSTEDFVPGFPFQIFNLTSKGCSSELSGLTEPGCYHLEFLPLCFIIDIVFWIFLMYLIPIIYQKFKKLIK